MVVIRLTVAEFFDLCGDNDESVKLVLPEPGDRIGFPQASFRKNEQEKMFVVF